MPECPEGGYDQPAYLTDFLSSPHVHPKSTQVIGLACDVIVPEQAAMQSRAARVIEFSSTWDNDAYQNGCHAAWVWDLYSLAQAVPDTHGLLIPKCISKFPNHIKCQISVNHCNWDTFQDALCALKFGTTNAPESVPIPWYKELPPGLPYSISNDPATCGLPILLNRYMPPIWRGSNPDPRYTNEASRAYVDNRTDIFEANRFKPPANFDVNKPVFESQSDYAYEPIEKEELIFQDPDAFGDYDDDEEPWDTNSADSSIHYGRYLWPQKILGGVFTNPAYSSQQAFTAAGLEFVGVRYHPRRIIIDLKNCILEVHLLLHTSVQVYILSQWDRVSRVPQTIRGFKIALAVIMRDYVLCFASSDNNCRVVWRTRKKADLLQKCTVPDAVLDYFEWSKWGAQWLRYYAPRRQTSTSIYQWLAKPGSTHHFQGDGSYMTDELLVRAGIAPSTPAFHVLNDPYLYCILHDAHVQLLIERVYRTKEQLRTTHQHSNPGEFAFCVKRSDQIAFASNLWVHGKKVTRVSARLANLVKDYNALAQRRTNVDLSAAVHPFELANIRHVSLLWGRLAPFIVEDRWETLVANEAEAALNDNVQLKKFVDRVPTTITELQHLTLIPITMLDEHQIAVLEASYPTHPIIEYFQNKTFYDDEYRQRQKERRKKKATSTPPKANKTKQVQLSNFFRKPAGSMNQKKLPALAPGVQRYFSVDIANFHLKPERRDHMLNTKLFVVGTQKRGTSWTFLEVPLFGKQMEGKQPWRQLDDKTRDERTIEHVKTRTKDWTVGWPDFCGHAQVVGQGVKGFFVALCRWDPGLTIRQQELLEKHWEQRGLYEPGMRKLSKHQLLQEKKWRLATKRKILQEWESSQKRNTPFDLVKEMRRIRKEERSPHFSNKRRSLFSAIQGRVLERALRKH
ncbi:hypothetical protein B0H13DRAFT_1993258 [Mycena leptocephala]|nr:hypothetical protein B0H13DRAFT_1993258 [Mycena leptocephala]